MMKKAVGFMALAIAVVCASSVAARASILVNDNFDRPDSNLVGTLPSPGPGLAWATHSGTNGPVQISGNQIQLTQFSSQTFSEDVNVPTGSTMQAGDRWYAGFDVTVDQPGSSISNVYFAHFLQGSTNFTSRIWVTAGDTSGFRFVLSNDNAIDGDGEVYSNDLVLGQAYRLVVSYDLTGGNGSLWIDQALESGTSIAATDPGFNNAVTAFAFRQGGGSNAPISTTQTIDNLCVATTYGEAYTCVPEPATLGLVAMGVVALIRRRR